MDDTDRLRDDAARTVERLLHSGERLQVATAAAEGIIAVTDRRVLVAALDRVALAVPFDSLRRIEFDIERTRPATLVIVPEHPGVQPQVLSIPPTAFADAARVLAEIGRRLAEAG